MANLLNVAKYDLLQEGVKYSSGIRSGARTAANFTVALGFRPKKIRVVNLTDRVEATHYVDPVQFVGGGDTKGLDVGVNVKGLLTIANGTRTYVATGIALTSNGLGFTTTVATVGLETDDDDVLWEAWG
jgi:hypothetical protein